MNKLLIVGSVAFDAIETPFGKTDKIIGGAGSYIALSSAFFGVNPNVISVVGYDFPKEYFDLLKSKGVNINGIKVEKKEKTMYWAGKYDTNMNNRETLVTELNSLGSFTPIVTEEYQNPEILMLGNLQPMVQKSVIDQLNKRPKLIIMDTMNFWMDTTPKELEQTIKMVDLLTINDEEARQLSGEYALTKAAKKILNMGLRYLIIKKGDNGALLFSKEGQKFFAPALPLDNVCDPTGAGDSFAGGLAGYIAKEGKTDWETIKAGVIAGSIMGSFCCERFGTENLTLINKEMFKIRANEFVEMTNYKINY